MGRGLCGVTDPHISLSISSEWPPMQPSQFNLAPLWPIEQSSSLCGKAMFSAACILRIFPSVLVLGKMQGHKASICLPGPENSGMPISPFSLSPILNPDSRRHNFFFSNLNLTGLSVPLPEKFRQLTFNPVNSNKRHNRLLPPKR